jgi:hypothetical protein
LPIPKLFESILVSKTFPERKGTFPDWNMGVFAFHDALMEGWFLC